MMKLLASTSVLALSMLTACATSAVTTAPPPNESMAKTAVCDASVRRVVRLGYDRIDLLFEPGDVLFEIDRIVGGDPATKLADLVYASGAWRSTGPGGKNTTGCFTAAELATIHNDVATSPWLTTPNQGIRCHAETLEVTTYVAHGKAVFSHHGCSDAILDDVSATHLGEITKLFADAIARPAAEPRASSDEAALGRCRTSLDAHVRVGEVAFFDRHTPDLPACCTLLLDHLAQHPDSCPSTGMDSPSVTTRRSIEACSYTVTHRTPPCR